MKRPTRRDIARLNNVAHKFYSAISDKPPMMTEPVSEPRKQRAPGTNGDMRPLEREVLKAVWHYLSVHPKVAWVTRINAGGTSFSDGHGKQQFVRFNYKRGISDIIGQLKAQYGGKFLACEAKREGEDLMPHQRDFLNEVIAAGGVAFVARCVEDCEEGLR